MKISNIKGHTLLTFPTLPSTSDYLRENEAPVGTIVRALTQSAGRGRRGNGFLSQAGGLYFSMKLPRSMPDSEMWAVTFMAANALCDAMALYGADPMIKWVNDVYLGDRKVCGILCEVREDHLILGIGVNVENVRFPSELQPFATSLWEEGIHISSDELLEDILGCFYGAFEGWDVPAALESYRGRSMLTGKEIRYTENGQIKYARALGIADNGNLICQRDGEIFALSSGEVFAVRSAETPSAQ